MTGGRGAAVAAFLALGACAAQAPDSALTPPGGETVLAGYDRAIDQQFLEAPFARGAMAVVFPGAGEVEPVVLVPCSGGRAVCQEGVVGPPGSLRTTPDWLVVTGLYGRSYWLGRGGKGFVERDGRFAPLAWAPQAEGAGRGPDDGSAASLETAASHGPADPLATPLSVR